MEGMETAEAIQREQLERMRDFLGPQAQPEGHSTRSTSKIESLITFKNPRAREFFVDGTSIPDVNFDAGPSWSGLMPISGHPNETRKLFFWFWPTNNAANVNDLLFWTNGGPGCSSLEGFLQENGPISWSWGQAEPTPNPWSWTNLSNVLWVEQPVGTGFSQGDPDISNDDELAAQVAGFLQQFLEVFSELKGSNFWVSGESYAGFYVPYIANYLYEHPGIVDLQLHGIWIADPSLTWGLVQQEIPALRFAQANKNVFPFNSSFWAQLQNISDSCGYTDYLDSVTYPPKGQLPLPVGATFNETTRAVGVKPECRIHSPIQRAVGVINPVFDVYRVTDTFPNLWSVLGFPRSTQKFIYFNRTDVQDAIHAPHITWEACSDRSVYINPTTGGPGNDQSVASTLSVLPNVIEKSKRVAIVHGLADFILVAEGTRIAIQNMTWNGKQGFQSPIEPETFLVENMGTFGNMHIERGLAFVEFYYSGHMTPQFVPWAAFQTIAYVLGKRDSPSA
ncbi:alpha/beta-hydrolase [Trametes coccinea BRFM310]|uniref:Carboxypeptidase n=1 Tax=Trametes coccinea (strain BRFM310) TaxID=1353009 RepID=A0A1Y2IYL8_TRAC3|nr:alpha/beta-hydrolase [Trametes coccinea BRFM310]